MYSSINQHRVLLSYYFKSFFRIEYYVIDDQKYY